MRTTILKYDYYIQIALGFVDVASIICCWFIPYVILAVQVIIGIYQLCSSGTHILLQHKSIGFFQWRMRHFFGSLAYLLLLYIMGSSGLLNTSVFVVMTIVIPQAILLGYIVLCKKELDFIEAREFHILK